MQDDRVDVNCINIVELLVEKKQIEDFRMSVKDGTMWESETL